MRYLSLALVVFCCLISNLKGEEHRSLPLIVEQMDTVLIVQVETADYRRIVFIRDGKVIATRLLVDDMLWTTCDDKFQLIWQDYWTAERVVEFKNLYSLVLPEGTEDPTQIGQDGLWWAMFRNMTDLKQP